MYAGVPIASPGLGELLLGVAAERAGDAEIGHEGVGAGEEDVLGLEIAVDDALLVGVAERVGGLADDPDRVGNRKLSLAREPGPQGLALDERHREPEDPAPALRPSRSAVEHGEDVRVLQPRGEPDLALEPLGAERHGELGVQDLERDRTVVPKIVHEVDGRHAAAAELALDPVAPGQVRLQGLQLGHVVAVAKLRMRRKIRPPHGFGHARRLTGPRRPATQRIRTLPRIQGNSQCREHPRWT